MTIYLLFLIPLFAFAHVASMGLDPKIVGGRFATPGEIPYQVSLQRIETENHFCGGVIISQWYILTAAHCVDGVNVSTISAHVGLINLREPHAVHLIESSYIHENYNRNDTTNDIALLKLQSPLKYSSLVSPVVLTANETVPAGTGAAVSGFGRLFYRGKGPKSTRLYVANIEIASQAFCLKMYTRFAFRNINDKQICANDPMVERGSCTGDAGGPLTVNGELIGIVSWQFECGSKIYPTVYVRVPSYFSWIVEHT